MIHQKIAISILVKVQKTNFEIINKLQRNLHLLGVKREGSQALFLHFLNKFSVKRHPKAQAGGEVQFNTFWSPGVDRIGILGSCCS